MDGGGPAQYDRLTTAQLKKVLWSLQKVKKDLKGLLNNLNGIVGNINKASDIFYHLGIEKISRSTEEAASDAEWAEGNIWQAIEDTKKEIDKVKNELAKSSSI